MKLFVGLGNPGDTYQNNRHNIGFLALERIAASHGFGPWRLCLQWQADDQGQFKGCKPALQACDLGQHGNDEG